MDALIKIIESSLQNSEIQTELDKIDSKTYKFHIPHIIMLGSSLEVLVDTLYNFYDSEQDGGIHVSFELKPNENSFDLYIKEV